MTTTPEGTTRPARPPATHPSTTTDAVPEGTLGSHSMLLPGRPNLLLAHRTVVSRARNTLGNNTLLGKNGSVRG